VTARVCLEFGNNAAGYCGMHGGLRTYDLDKVTCKCCLITLRDVGKIQMERAKARLRAVRASGDTKR
jgi:hypothetical protein